MFISMSRVLYKNALQNFTSRNEDQDMKELFDKDFSDASITAYAFINCNLHGIQLYSMNSRVRELNLAKNALVSISFVPFLPYLEFLQLQGNPIVDYLPLKSLGFLHYLYVNEEDVDEVWNILNGN